MVGFRRAPAHQIVASIYGMNFKEMPELNWRLGYPLALSSHGVRGGAPLPLLSVEEKIMALALAPPRCS